MRKIGITTALLLLAAAMAVAQTSTGQSAANQAQGAASGAAGTAQSGASSAAGAVQSGAEKAGGAVKSGAETGYNKTKNAVTGNSDQTSDQNQAGTETGAGGTETGAGTMPKTASPLPLLGFLGLGAVSLGALRSRLFRR